MFARRCFVNKYAALVDYYCQCTALNCVNSTLLWQLLIQIHLGGTGVKYEPVSFFFFLKATCPFEEKNNQVGSTLKRFMLLCARATMWGVTFSKSIYPTQGRNVNWWGLGAPAKAREGFRVICAKSQADLMLKDNLQKVEQFWQRARKTVYKNKMKSKIRYQKWTGPSPPGAALNCLRFFPKSLTKETWII